MCCLLGNPSLGQSQQGNGSGEEKLLCRNIPVPFQYVLLTAGWYIRADTQQSRKVSMWTNVGIIRAAVLTFSFGQSAEIGVDQSQLKMLQRRRKEGFIKSKNT